VREAQAREGKDGLVSDVKRGMTTVGHTPIGLVCITGMKGKGGSESGTASDAVRWGE